MPTDIYERQKRYERKVHARAADIGDIPPVKNPPRRAGGERDLLFFLVTYFPASTGQKPFSDDHKRMIARIQRCALEGGLFLNLFPRGFAKTTIGENSAIWVALYGHRRFIPIFAADASSAAGNIESIKLELSENELLLEDFPEACHAIRALEGKPQRCASQTHKGQQTHIEWRSDEIVLPSIEGSVSSGAILTAKGLTGASRGMKHKRPDGTQQRPDFILLDDPQTDESAATPLQVEKRLSTIRKSILKLGGHDRKVAVVVNATVIRRGDLTDKLKALSSWQCELVKMVKKWADVHETLWLTDYARLRTTYDADSLGDQQRAHREATEFYKLNRERMDAGCVVSWEYCFDPATEESAIQHAYNSLIDDGEEVFASECQNDPLVEKVEDDDLTISADAVAKKLNKLDRGMLPVEATRLVAFIDPKKELLYWTVVALADGFSGWIVDYGTYPDQKRSYFSSRKPRVTLSKTTKAPSWEASLYAGLDNLTNQLASKEWDRLDGAKIKLERAAVDAHWGDATETVKQFCRQSNHAAILIPSFGLFVGATSRPFNESQAKPGERRGPNWRIPPVNAKGAVRHLLFDVNWYKSFTANRFKTPFGGRGCLSIFGSDPEQHRLFADHQASEKPKVVESKGRRVVQWDQLPGVDNDYFDAVVGCMVLGSVQGVSLHENKAAKPRKVVTFREREKTRKVWRPNA